MTKKWLVDDYFAYLLLHASFRMKASRISWEEHQHRKKQINRFTRHRQTDTHSCWLMIDWFVYVTTVRVLSAVYYLNGQLDPYLPNIFFFFFSSLHILRTYVYIIYQHYNSYVRT